MPQPVILAIANQKGGVGKTTTAVNLGAALARAGKRTLIIDADPQGNASTGLGVAVAERDANLYTVLAGRTPAERAIRPTAQEGLSILPANQDLAAMEIELAGSDQRQFSFRAQLGEAAADFDVVLIDCPPALGLLTLNSLSWADHVLVPLQAEFFALEGLAFLLREVVAAVVHGQHHAKQAQPVIGAALDPVEGAQQKRQPFECEELGL